MLGGGRSGRQPLAPGDDGVTGNRQGHAAARQHQAQRAYAGRIVAEHALVRGVEVKVVADAVRAVASGADAVVAQGGEAGLLGNRAHTAGYTAGRRPAMVVARMSALDLIGREPSYSALSLAKAKAFARMAGLLAGLPVEVAGASTCLRKAPFR